MIKPPSEHFAAKLPAIPRLADVSPAYRQLIEKEQALKERQRELKQELQDFQHIRKDSQRDRVAALLEGDGKPASTPTRRIEDISQDIYDVQDALEIIARDISTERMKASNEICTQIAPQHRELVRDLWQAMLVMNTACLAYRAFMQDVNGKNIAWSQLRPMYPSWAGEHDDRMSVVALWLREAAQYGFITDAEIPEHLR
ncbi:MAG: hypothetical protein DI589_22975 [Shinella sp.]|nr:MAG: hypothetical protein DI589_22975 [Shinella sp.]